MNCRSRFLPLTFVPRSCSGYSNSFWRRKAVRDIPTVSGVFLSGVFRPPIIQSYRIELRVVQFCEAFKGQITNIRMALLESLIRSFNGKTTMLATPICCAAYFHFHHSLNLCRCFRLGRVRQY